MGVVEFLIFYGAEKNIIFDVKIALKRARNAGHEDIIAFLEHAQSD